MSIRFTGDKTAIRRLDNLPTAHNNFTICGFAKLLVAAPTRTATIAYTQTAVGDSSETFVLGGDGTKARAGDDYGGAFSSDIATVTAGGASGANWFFFALVGVGTGSTGIRGYHATVGGTPSFQTVNNRAGSSAFSVIQFGDLPYGTEGWFDGLLAHLKVYDRALSDVELTAEAGRGTPATTTGLISYHAFSNATLSTALVPDQGSGTLSVFPGGSDPSTSTDMPVFAAGAALSGSDTLPQRAAVAPTVVTVALPAGSVGVAYSQTLAASGDTPITWAVTSGALPSGVTLNTSTGVISGTPSGAGTATFTVTATNAYGSDAQALSIVVAGAPTTPSIQTTTLPVSTSGVAYSQTFSALGASPITWSVSSGSLPPGLTLNSATGVLSGTPTAVGSYLFTVSATNSFGSASQLIQLGVAGQVTVPPAENDGWIRLPRDIENWIRLPRTPAGDLAVETSLTWEVNIVLRWDGEDLWWGIR